MLFLAKVCAPAAAARARVMLIISALKSCQLFSSRSPNMSKTFLTFFADDSISPITFCGESAARSHFS